MGKPSGPVKGAAVVLDSQGRELSLGDLLELLVSRSDLPITRIAEAAGVSRSFFYLLRDDKQIPSLESVVSLLAACESGEVRLADIDEPGEVVVTTGGETYYVHLSSARSRFASSTLRSSQPPMLSAPHADRRPDPSAHREAVWGSSGPAVEADRDGEPGYAAAGAPAHRDLTDTAPGEEVGGQRPVPAALTGLTGPTGPTVQRRFTRAREGGRDRLLGDLLDVAGGLEPERLELLVEYARLLRRS